MVLHGALGWVCELDGLVIIDEDGELEGNAIVVFKGNDADVGGWVGRGGTTIEALVFTPVGWWVSGMV